jgi:hypothetical protein
MKKVWVQFTRGGPCAVFPESEKDRAQETLGPGMSLALFEMVERREAEQPAPTETVQLRKKVADQARALRDLQRAFDEWRAGHRAALTGAHIETEPRETPADDGDKSGPWRSTR